MIKTIVASAFIAIAAIGMAGEAKSQPIDVNCAALQGTPLMCVKNSAAAPVVAIQATSRNSYNPNGWIRIPGGPIMPGGTSIVKFNAWEGGCTQYVTIQTADGKTHTYPNVNVCNSTSFNVTNW